MYIFDEIQRTRDYLNYLENHGNAVRDSFNDFCRQCSSMRVVTDDMFYQHLLYEVFYHDVSKFSHEEFIPYRDNFFRCEYRGRQHSEPELFEIALQHHYDNNAHHHQTIKKKLDQAAYVWHPVDWEVDVAHMIIDWMAVGRIHGSNAREYYRKVRDDIGFPEYVHAFIEEVFNCVFGYEPCNEQ